MPLAPKTFRSMVQPWTDAEGLNSLARIFLRAARGVVFLHTNEIVHRDLKPENILIADDGTPWVADLGIAHVNPEFVSGSLQTIEREHLLNRDYYAPEQRFGSAQDVDARADIYALGCIFYELIIGTPPVRNNCPALSTRDEALIHLERVFERMTAYSPDDRYQRLDDAIEDLSIGLGTVLATMRGGRAAANRDLPTMIKLLRSSNEKHRDKGIAIAKELGDEALESLHDLLGHGRREVRNSAALALGEIKDPGSLSYLVAALYGNAKKFSTFRPSADTASKAIARYQRPLRLQACGEIRQPVLGSQVLEILHGLPANEAYPAFADLSARGLILLDWGESELKFLVRIDEDRAWPGMRVLLDARENWKVRGVLPYLSPPRQAECIKLLLPRLDSYYDFEGILKTLQTSAMADRLKLEGLTLLLERTRAFTGRFDSRDAFIKAVQREQRKLGVPADGSALP
jgi:hypothetical protein